MSFARWWIFLYKYYTSIYKLQVLWQCCFVYRSFNSPTYCNGLKFFYIFKISRCGGGFVSCEERKIARVLRQKKFWERQNQRSTWDTDGSLTSGPLDTPRTPHQNVPRSKPSFSLKMSCDMFRRICEDIFCSLMIGILAK